MACFSILLKLSLCFTLLKNLVNEEKIFLSSFDSDVVYPVEGVVFGATRYVKYESATYENAVQKCRQERKTMFRHQPDIDLTKLYKTLGLTEIWTDISKSSVNGSGGIFSIYPDEQQYPHPNHKDS